VIRSNFRRFPDANVAIVTGVASGIFVIEADTVKGHGVDGIASISALEDEHGPLPETLMAISPSGSVHRYYKHPGPGIKIKNSVSEIAPGVDIRGDGGMVIAPPSVKPDAGKYKWLNDLPVTDAPPWLIQAAREKPKPEKVKKSSPARGRSYFEALGKGKTSLADADLAEMEAALMAIPNDASVNWGAWNRIGMAVFSATRGSAAGFA
jgi:Bifunctional DNA primase/polymerase, N-terminal